MGLRTDIVRIASELPSGDSTRRELLAALSQERAIQADYVMDDGVITSRASTVALVAKNLASAARKGDARQIKINVKSNLSALADVLIAVGDQSAAEAVESSMSRVKL
jgi:hypothetical protein